MDWNLFENKKPTPNPTGVVHIIIYGPNWGKAADAIYDARTGKIWKEHLDITKSVTHWTIIKLPV